MANPIGIVLDELGLYRPLRRLVRRLADPQQSRREREVREDLARTGLEVGAWARAGQERGHPDRLFGIVSFTNLPLHAKFHCLVGKAMQLRGYTPVIFTWSGCRLGHRYFELFGFDRLVMWDEHLAVTTEHDAGEVEAIVSALLPAAPTVSQLTSLRFRGVDIGKHALSMTCRRRVEGRLDLTDQDTLALLRRELSEAVRSVLAAEYFYAKHPIEKMLVRDAGYTPNGALFELGLERGVDCVVYEQGQRRGTWIVKRYTSTTKGQHYFSLAPSTWERVRRQPWTDEDEARLEREFAERYKPDSTDDTRRLMSGKKLKRPEEVRTQLGLDRGRRTAVIFSHLAWDAAFFFGTCLFEDFEEWLLETVKFVARECPQVNWLVKLHPFNAFKLKREGRSEESEMRLLRDIMPLPDHVRLIRADTDINTRSLFGLVDYVLTVNGTVGMEFPCHGVPAILGGRGRYDGLGFTVDPTSREEYFTTLRRLHELPPLAMEARQFARRHFLTLMRSRQISLEDVAPMELKRLNEAQSDVHDNIRITARSLEEFSTSPSIRLLADWLAYSTEADLLGPAA